jgi:hypothetical protein
METLVKIQNELKVPKGNVNKFGNYKYRSAEDILENVKPLLLKHKAHLSLSDEIVFIGNKFFLKATACFNADNVSVNCYGYAETAEHKGMSAEQTTGTASSYARKYALNGLFLIDETEADADSQKPAERKETPKVTEWLDELQFDLAMKAKKGQILNVLKQYNGQSGKGMTPDQTKKLTDQLSKAPE